MAQQPSDRWRVFVVALALERRTRKGAARVLQAVNTLAVEVTLRPSPGKNELHTCRAPHVPAHAPLRQLASSRLRCIGGTQLGRAKPGGPLHGEIVVVSTHVPGRCAQGSGVVRRCSDSGARATFQAPEPRPKQETHRSASEPRAAMFGRMGTRPTLRTSGRRRSLTNLVGVHLAAVGP